MRLAFNQRALCLEVERPPKAVRRCRALRPANHHESSRSSRGHTAYPGEFAARKGGALGRRRATSPRWRWRCSGRQGSGRRRSKLQEPLTLSQRGASWLRQAPDFSRFEEVSLKRPGCSRKERRNLAQETRPSARNDVVDYTRVLQGGRRRGQARSGRGEQQCWEVRSSPRERSSRRAGDSARAIAAGGPLR